MSDDEQSVPLPTISHLSFSQTAAGRGMTLTVHIVHDGLEGGREFLLGTLKGVIAAEAERFGLK